MEKGKRNAEAIHHEKILVSDYFVDFKLNRLRNILRVELFWPKSRPLARGNHKISLVDADSLFSVEIQSFDDIPFSEDFFFLIITGQNTSKKRTVWKDVECSAV